MGKFIYSVLFPGLFSICFTVALKAQVSSVNGTSGSVQINLSLNGNSLSITGGNTISLPYGYGDISSVTAGSYLSGGGSSGSLTFSADNSTAAWNVNKLQGKSISATAPAPGQVLKWNGTTWAPGTDEGGTGGSSLWLQSSSNIYFNAGNVGIGTSIPDQKLSVAGKIHAEEVIVDLNINAPDYVFQEDYQLMPLEELEEYLKQNKHLPGIPSASVLDSDGISLSTMNMLILQKTEELTLYILNHEERINTLLRRTQTINSNNLNIQK